MKTRLPYAYFYLKGQSPFAILLRNFLFSQLESAFNSLLVSELSTHKLTFT